MTLIHMHHWSDALAKASSLFVTVPDGATGRLPLVCLLHGLSDDHTIWQRRTSIERYAQRHGVMVAMPDGGRAWYCDSQLGRYEAHILESIDHVERLLPAVGTRTGRAIAGLSMGGYGAFKIALRHPERFCAAVSHSGALDAIRFANDPGCGEAKYIFTGRGARAE
ncbi:MAG: prolyl oligopeptidase family serine peptidase, partial [Planctomycetes bacterium]|nr:prolyl oligopeptidase family serine peptidase [Planctomycetota bacterium]